MSNPFYTFAPSFVPGSLARAGDVNTQMTNIQTGFDKVNTGNVAVGTDSGSANTVVLTMTTTRTAYTNGDEFVFTPAVQNTGASTIKVDGLGTLPLVRYNGTALQAADLLVGTWYTARYVTASNSVQVISPASYTLAAGIVSAAAPTHKVGLTAAGGVSTNVLPIDVTFAIDTAIAPTWTGAHTFNGATLSGSATATWTGAHTFNGATLSGSATATWTGAHTFNAGVTVNAATRNVATLGQSAQTYGNAVDNPTYTFQGTGAFSVGGNISAANFNGFANPTASLGLTAVNGTAITAMRSDAAPALSQAITPTWTGSHIFQNGLTAAQTSGAISVNSTTATNAANVFYQLGGVAKGRLGVEGTSGATITGSSAGDLYWYSTGGSFLFSQGGAAAALKIGPSGNVTINAPSSGNPLTVNGVGGGGGLYSVTANASVQATADFMNSSTTAGAMAYGRMFNSVNYFAWGTTATTTTSNIWSGTTGIGESCFLGASGNVPLSIATNSTERVRISGAGSVTVNAPTSGNALIVSGVAAQNVAQISGAASTGSSFGLRIDAGTNSSDRALYVGNQAGSTQYLNVRGDGLVQAIDQGNTLQDVGWRGAPINNVSTNYTLALSDRGKSVQATANLTVTVPANVFVGGDAITVTVGSGATITVAQGASMTLQWAGNGATTGSRTLTGAGMCVLLFQNATSALISGAGLT